MLKLSDLKIEGEIIDMTITIQDKKTKKRIVTNNKDPIIEIDNYTRLILLDRPWLEANEIQDARCYDSISKNKNMLIPWYLMSCFAYYHRDVNIISDELFDRICWRLDRELSELEHWHKYLIPTPNAKSGAFSILEEAYPTIIKSSAKGLLFL